MPHRPEYDERLNVGSMFEAASLSHEAVNSLNEDRLYAFNLRTLAVGC